MNFSQCRLPSSRGNNCLEDKCLDLQSQSWLFQLQNSCYGPETWKLHIYGDDVVRKMSQQKHSKIQAVRDYKSIFLNSQIIHRQSLSSR